LTEDLVSMETRAVQPKPLEAKLLEVKTPSEKKVFFTMMESYRWKER